MGQLQLEKTTFSKVCSSVVPCHGRIWASTRAYWTPPGGTAMRFQPGPQSLNLMSLSIMTNRMEGVVGEKRKEKRKKTARFCPFKQLGGTPQKYSFFLF